MNNKIQVLDHGYVQLIESWGSDERIIESARMSTGKGFQGWGPKHGEDCKSRLYEFAAKKYVDPLACGCTIKSGDEKLLSYLYTHKHLTPFEMCGVTFEIQAPIFVFREWHRHRTQSYNELSARYTPLPDLNYMPTNERVLLTQKGNNQAVGLSGTEINENKATIWRGGLEAFYRNAQLLYDEGLALGVPKELARLCVPVARYSKMRASANLRNWLAFLTLRMDNAAQWEIRQYANAVGLVISQLFPRTWELFMGEKK